MDPKQAAAVIVAYMNSNDIDVPESLKGAALDFARACQELNSRLVTCDELLKSNQRSEAIRQVQLEPDALQLFSALDIRNWNEWANITARVGLPVPPPLNAAATRNLHKAFTAEQSVKALLVQHRLLAVSRAPLKRRLEVLRLLAKAEPTNLGWSTDVRAYEAARFEEIRAALDDPERIEDWDATREVHDELNGAWTAPPPLDLVGTARARYKEFRQSAGKKRLDELNPQLQRAMADGDLEGAERVAAQVRATAKEYELPKNSSRLALLRQAEKWIEEEGRYLDQKQKFERAVDELRGALEQNIDADLIRRCYQRVLTYDQFDAPGDVTADYAAWSRGRSRLAWAGAIAAVLTGITLYLVFFRK